MNYLKSLIICIVYLTVMLLAWHFSTIHNVLPRYLDDAYRPLLIGAGLIIAGFLLSRLPIGTLALIGQGAVYGGVIGIVPCIMNYLGMLLSSMVNGIFLGIIAWIFFTLLIAACAAAAVSALKSGILSALRLDFYPLVIGAMVCLSAIVGVMILFTYAKDASGFLAFACAIGLLGSAGGLYVGMPDGSSVITDSNGNQHYVISTLTSGRVITTDGVTMRANASGAYEPLS